VTGMLSQVAALSPHGEGVSVLIRHAARKAPRRVYDVRGVFLLLAPGRIPEIKSLIC